MLTRNDILSMGYLKKTSFSGSYKGMRFLLKKETKEENSILSVLAWPEPYALDHTDPDKVLSSEKTFSEEGVREAVDWLNEVYPQIVP